MILSSLDLCVFVKLKNRIYGRLLVVVRCLKLVWYRRTKVKQQRQSFLNFGWKYPVLLRSRSKRSITITQRRALVGRQKSCLFFSCLLSRPVVVVRVRLSRRCVGKDARSPNRIKMITYIRIRISQSSA